MRLTWQSKIVLGSTVWPEDASEPIGKAALGIALCFTENVAEVLIFRQRFQPAEQSEIGDPAVADRVGDYMRECRVRQQQPTTRCDSVGLIVEAFGEHLSEVFHGRRAQQFGMNRRHTVGAVRSDDREVGHADLLSAGFFDEAHALNAALIAGKAARTSSSRRRLIS